jgi:hypothetical protein
VMAPPTPGNAPASSGTTSRSQPEGPPATAKLFSCPEGPTQGAAVPSNSQPGGAPATVAPSCTEKPSGTRSSQPEGPRGARPVTGTLGPSCTEEAAQGAAVPGNSQPEGPTGTLGSCTDEAAEGAVLHITPQCASLGQVLTQQLFPAAAQASH